MTVTKNAEPIIELKDITFQYRKGTELLFDGLDLSIYENEIVGIIGASGAGKTSLLYLMNGVIPQFYTAKVLEGEIFYKGEQIGENALGRISQHIGLVLDDPDAQLFNLYVEDELIWGPENLGLSKEEITNRKEYVIEKFDLKDIIDRTTYGLSGGQKQKLAIAAVAALQPKVMMLDEPTSALDPAGTQLVFDAVKTMAKNLNMTIIMVEHKVEQLANYVDRMLLVQNGKIALDLPPDEFFAETEKIGESGIVPPQATILGQRLKKKGIAINPPLTLQDGVSTFDSLIGNKSRVWKEPTSANSTLNQNLNQDDGILVVNDLHYTYPTGTHALKGINMALQEGEFVCIIGQNGSGKTTLSKCVKKIIDPPKNSIYLNGIDLNRYKSHELTKKVGYVFQNPDHQLFKDYVESEIEFGLKNLGMPTNDRKAKVRETLERFGLWEQRKTHPFKLSRGERQFLALSAIYAMEPDILIADEPTTGLDRRSADKLMNELLAINRDKGTNVVVITHWIQLAAEYGQRIIALRDGKVLLDQDPRNAFSQTSVLAKTNVMPPQISQLFSELQISPVPLTINEGEEAMLKILQNGGN